jgi:hypothetical protein
MFHVETFSHKAPHGCFAGSVDKIPEDFKPFCLRGPCVHFAYPNQFWPIAIQSISTDLRGANEAFKGQRDFQNSPIRLLKKLSPDNSYSAPVIRAHAE